MSRIAFISYFQAEWELHSLELGEPLAVAQTADFGAPGPVIDFQIPVPHTLVAENSRRKGTFENMFIDGRPPVNVGVTSGGDFFGGTAVSFTDVLGDKQFTFYAESVSRYRTLSLSYVNLSRRFNFALQGYSQTQFFYGNLEGVFFDPRFSGIVDRDFSIATRTIRGGTAFGIWPLDRFRRIELSGGVQHYDESFNDPSLATESQNFQQATFGRQLLREGTSFPLGVTFVQETTVFREFGPLAGNTIRATMEFSPSIGDSLSRQTRRPRRPVLSAPQNDGGCSRCEPVYSRAGATPQISCTSGGTRSFAAMNTWNSSVTRSRSSMPNSAFHSSRPC